jgi:hypothetical protein
LELYDASKPEWQMPDFIQADTELKTGLMDGLAEIQDMASLSIPSWNQIVGFLDSMQQLKALPGFAA